MTVRTTVSIELESGSTLMLQTDPGESLYLDDFYEYMKEATGRFIPLTLITGDEIFLDVDKIQILRKVDVPRTGGVRAGGVHRPGKYIDEE